MAKVLIIEDDPVSLRVLINYLEDHHEVFTAENLIDSISILASTPIEIIVADYRLPDGTALDLLRALQSEAKKIPVLLASKFTGAREMSLAWKYGAFDFMIKPVSKERMMETIELALSFGHLDQDSKSFNRELLFKNLRQIEVIFNYQKFVAETQLSPEAVVEVLQETLTETKLQKERFHHFISQPSGDFNASEVYEAIHRLQSTCGGIFAEALSRVCDDVSSAHERGEKIQKSDLEEILREIGALRLQIELHLNQELLPKSPS